MLEANHLVDLRDVGYAPRHVLEAFLVGLLVWNQLDFRRRMGQILHSLGELSNAHFLGAADVVNFADGTVAQTKAMNRRNDVGHVAKAPRLLARAVYRDVGPRESLSNERGNDHPVPAGLTRANRIEEAYDRRRKPSFLPVGESEK